MPTPCRCHVASGIETLRAHRLARTVQPADPRHHRLLYAPMASDLGRDRPAKRPACRSWTARKRRQLPTPAHPNPQIPISLRTQPAGSFFGDFRTPSGVRNSSRKRKGRYGQTDEKQIFVDRLGSSRALNPCGDRLGRVGIDAAGVPHAGNSPAGGCRWAPFRVRSRRMGLLGRDRSGGRAQDCSQAT